MGIQTSCWRRENVSTKTIPAQWRAWAGVRNYLQIQLETRNILKAIHTGKIIPQQLPSQIASELSESSD
jgi:hypothetical protein